VGGRTTRELTGTLAELGFLAALVDRITPRIIPMSWERVDDMLTTEDARTPGADGDVVAYRRIDGLMAPIFARTGSRQA
jgi:hypothetical protein